ncbi:MAG: LysR family transcriptional regulator [Pseudonocardia sp.]|nr:LysR family transcriptional regulator [Pseudonocardia sp.]
MELQQLEYFVAIAEERNFSRGAQRMHAVQSAVSTAVAKLERELDVQLFNPPKHQTTLTPAGEALLAEACNTLNAARRARDVVTTYHGKLSGTVDVGILMSLGPLLRPRWISPPRSATSTLAIHWSQCDCARAPWARRDTSPP